MQSIGIEDVIKLALLGLLISGCGSGKAEYDDAHNVEILDDLESNIRHYQRDMMDWPE